MDYQKVLELTERDLGSLRKTLLKAEQWATLYAVDVMQERVSNALDEMDKDQAKHIKAMTEGCKHVETDTNDHNIPFCLDCGANLLSERDEVRADMEMQRQKEGV